MQGRICHSRPPGAVSTCCPVLASPQPSTVPQCTRHFLETSRFIDLNNCHVSSSISCSEGGGVYYFYFLLRYFKMGGGEKKEKKRIKCAYGTETTVEFITRGPPLVIPSHVNGTGWSQGSCTRNTEKDQRWQSCTFSHTGPHMAAMSHPSARTWPRCAPHRAKGNGAGGGWEPPAQHCGICCFLLQGRAAWPTAPWKTGPFTVAGFVFGTLSRQEGQEQAARKTSAN